MNIYGKETRIKVRKGFNDKVRRTKTHANLKYKSRAKQKHSFRQEICAYK